MTDTIVMEKVILNGEVIYMTHEDVMALEEKYSKMVRLYPHTEKSRKEYEKA